MGVKQRHNLLNRWNRKHKKLIICFLWLSLSLQDTGSAATGHYQVQPPSKHSHCRCSGATGVSKLQSRGWVVIEGRKLFSHFRFNYITGNSQQWYSGPTSQFHWNNELSPGTSYESITKGDQVRGETRDFHYGVFRITPSFKIWGSVTWISSLVGSVLFQKEHYLIRILNSLCK